MAVHYKKVDPAMRFPYQIFSNDTSLSDAVTFADGDYIDFEASLGRPAKQVRIVLTGIVDITLKFNTKLKVSKFQESQVDSTIEITEGVNNTNSLRLFSETGEQLEWNLPPEFPIQNIKIEDYTGTASADDNLTIIGY